MRALDNPIMRARDLLLAFPAVLLAVAPVAVLRPGLAQVIVARAVRSVPGEARITRSAVLAVRHLAYTGAARALGAPGWRVPVRTILPNGWTVIFVVASLQVGDAILRGSASSVLGLGVNASPTADGIRADPGRPLEAVRAEDPARDLRGCTRVPALTALDVMA